MAGSGEEYLISRRKKIERRQKILTFVSIVSFVGSGVFAIAPTLQEAFQNPKSEAVSVDSSLQQQMRGYELVLQRDPENRVALNGLVNIRIKLGDVKGAIAPLEKLVKVHPERQNYKVLLEQLKKQVSKGER